MIKMDFTHYLHSQATDIDYIVDTYAYILYRHTRIIYAGFAKSV